MQPDPRTAYENQLVHFRAAAVGWERQRSWLGHARFLVFLATVCLFVATVIAHFATPWFLIIPVGAFLALSYAFERATRRGNYARGAIRHYELALARINDQWAGRGVQGSEYLSDGHPFAVDLDL